MGTVILPTNFDRKSFTASYELDGQVYEFRCYYNRMDSTWYADLLFGGDALIRGLRLITEWDLLAPYRYIDDLPPGTLRLSDTQGAFVDADDETFGTRVKLVYDEVAE